MFVVEVFLWDSRDPQIGLAGLKPARLSCHHQRFISSPAWVIAHVFVRIVPSSSYMCSTYHGYNLGLK